MGYICGVISSFSGFWVLQLKFQKVWIFTTQDRLWDINGQKLYHNLLQTVARREKRQNFLGIMGSQNWWFGDPRTLRKNQSQKPLSEGPMILRDIFSDFSLAKRQIDIIILGHAYGTIQVGK